MHLYALAGFTGTPQIGIIPIGCMQPDRHFTAAKQCIGSQGRGFNSGNGYYTYIINIIINSCRPFPALH
jgi:hypothetical protein